MRKHKISIWGISAAFLMLFLIFDAKMAFIGASEGIDLCIKTVIPSLFPFFFLSGILNTSIAGKHFKILRPLGKLCGMPENSEYLLLIGVTGGYPVGAQCISNSYKNGILTKQDAERMLGFCSNAGPAFIFGIMGQMFPSLLNVWALWLIQIICALITGYILPKKSINWCTEITIPSATVATALQNAIKAMASVCGWVVIFRVFITTVNRWVFWMLPAEYSVIISGVLELSNGCIALNTIKDIPLRYVAASFILSFGGICVGMQTMSVCQELSCKTYFLGKAIQSLLSVPISMIIGSFLFPGNSSYTIVGIMILGFTILGCGLFKNFVNNTGKPSLHHV